MLEKSSYFYYIKWRIQHFSIPFFAFFVLYRSLKHLLPILIIKWGPNLPSIVKCNKSNFYLLIPDTALHSAKLRLLTVDLMIMGSNPSRAIFFQRIFWVKLWRHTAGTLFKYHDLDDLFLGTYLQQFFHPLPSTRHPLVRWPLTKLGK